MADAHTFTVKMSACPKCGTYYPPNIKTHVHTCTPPADNRRPQKLEAVYTAALAVRKLTNTHEECSCKLCISSWRKFWRMVDAVEGNA